MRRTRLRSPVIETLGLLIMDYEEKTFDGKRHYILSDTNITVKGKVFLSSDFDVTIDLKTLNPNYEKHWIRSGSFNQGITMALVFIIGASIIRQLFELSLWDSPVPFLYLLGFCGVLLMAVTFKKIEYACFNNSSGTQVLGIARAGKRKSEFNDFINQLCDNIKNSPQT